jgi:aspartyl-tRNA synthetase
VNESAMKSEMGKLLRQSLENEFSREYFQYEVDLTGWVPKLSRKIRYLTFCSMNDHQNPMADDKKISLCEKKKS